MNTLIINNKIDKYENIELNIIDEIINKSESIVLLDIKGELYKKYSYVFQQNNYNINVLNLDNLQKTNSFNPMLMAFDYYDKDINITYNLLEYMWKVILDDSYEEKFAVSFSLLLFQLSDRKAINLYSIKEMLKSDINNFVKLNNEYLKELLSLDRNQINNILNKIFNKVNLYLKNSLLSDVISYTNVSFDFSKKQVYFVIPSSKVRKLNKLLNIFLYQITYKYNIDTFNLKKLNIILNKANIFTNSGFLDKLIDYEKFNLVLVYEAIDEYKNIFSLDKIDCIYNINNKDLIIKVENKIKQKINLTYLTLPNYEINKKIPNTLKEEKYLFNLDKYIEKNKNL